MSSTSSSSSSSDASTYTPKVVFVVGAAGFLGSNYCKHLLRRYPDVKVIGFDSFGSDSLSDKANIAEFANNKQFSFVEGRLGSADLLKVVFETNKVDTVVMLHNDNYDKRHQDTPGASVSMTQTCVLGTHIIIETAKFCGISRLIYVSSDEVFGVDDPSSSGAVIADPVNPYAATMIGSEHLLRSYVRSFKFPAIIARVCNVYGPKQPLNRLIPRCLANLADNKPCVVQGDGSSTRSWVYVDDVTSALDAILHKGKIGSIYNISAGDPMTVLDTVSLCISAVGLDDRRSSLITFEADRSLKDPRVKLSTTALEQLGWKAKTDISTGMRLMLTWIEAVGSAKAKA